MPATRYAPMFARLAARREGAFVPFLMVGDPAPGEFLPLVRAVVVAGADALELGLPFSDPVADGPVIQAAASRVLRRGTTMADCWTLIGACRTAWPELPIGLLVYANLVLHDAPERFFASARTAGVDSVLIADLPVAELSVVSSIAEAHGIALVLIAPPNASAETIGRVAESSRGYTYVVAREGVTGESGLQMRDASALIERLRGLGAPPPLLGFGVRDPAGVRRTLGMGAAGAIVGSALVAEGARCEGDTAGMVAAVGRLAAELKAATRET